MRREDIPPDRITRLSRSPTGQTRYRVEFKPIKLSDARNYLYGPVIITDVRDITRKATLIDVKIHKLILEQRMRGGSMTFDLPLERIKTLEAPHQVPY